MISRCSIYHILINIIEPGQTQSLLNDSIHMLPSMPCIKPIIHRNYPSLNIIPELIIHNDKNTKNGNPDSLQLHKKGPEPGPFK